MVLLSIMNTRVRIPPSPQNKFIMSTELIAKVWAIGWLTTSIISSFRVVRGKQANPSPYMDVLGYTLNWPIILPIFLVRWTKYKLKGKSL